MSLLSVSLPAPTPTPQLLSQLHRVDDHFEHAPDSNDILMLRPVYAALKLAANAGVTEPLAAHAVINGLLPYNHTQVGRLLLALGLKTLLEPGKLGDDDDNKGEDNDDLS